MGKRALISNKRPGSPVVFLDGGDTTGDIYFVNSVTGSDASGYGLTPDSPTATIDYAVGLCTASQGDRIYVMEDHVENISTGTSLVVDVAGIEIVGIGKGPLLTYTAAAGTISITAANCEISNLRLYSDFTNGVTTGITVGATADGLSLENIRMEEAANTKEFLIGISVAAACHNVVIDGFKFYGVTGGTDSQCIKFAGASNFSEVKNFEIYGDFSGAPIDGLTAASTYMTIGPGVIVNDDTTAGLSVSLHASTTGMMRHLDILQLKDTVGPAGAAMGYTQVLVSNAAGAQGILKPAADS
jgi:hypothetical protein